MTNSASPTRPIQRQISLPLSKAIELAYQSLRLRLSRSLLVTSGIVLALTFLMSILTTDAIMRSMRNWSQTIVAQGRGTPRLIDAQRLEAMMRSAGVPTRAAEIEGDRLQH